jgi:hypothetical protein
MTIIAVEDKRNDKPPAPGTEDAWTDWRPVWTGRNISPQDFQERHDPTEAFFQRLAAGMQREAGQRRIVDGRLWDSMDAVQQSAAVRIAASYESMGRGMGYVRSNWERMPGADSRGGSSDSQERMIGDYAEWARRCAIARISHAMVIDVLVFGVSLTKSDRDRRLRKGTARKNLFEGLDLYCRLRGWKR